MEKTDNEISSARIPAFRPTTDAVIDEEKVFNMNDPMARRFVERIKKIDQEKRSRLAAPGALGLPPLLDKRRLEFLVPDEAFRNQPIYDRIFVWQVSFHGDQETYGDTAIYMPGTVKDGEKYSSPRGILLAAGPIALDEIRSNGVELGHVVTFIRMAPWRIEIAIRGGKPEHVLVQRSCDLIASEDLATAIRDGEVKFVEFEVEKDGRKFFTHAIKDARRPDVIHPQQPIIPEDQ